MNDMNFLQIYYYSLLDDNNKQLLLNTPDKQSIINNYLQTLNDQNKQIYYNNSLSYMWSVVDDKIKWYYINLPNNQKINILNYNKNIIDEQATLFWNNTSEDVKNYLNMLNDQNKLALFNYTGEQILKIAQDYFNSVRLQEIAKEQEMLHRAQEEKMMARLKILELIPGFTQYDINKLKDKENEVKYNQYEDKNEILDIDIDNIGTNDRLTKFEVSLLVGKRARMIEQNAIPTINPGNLYNAVDIAILELKARRIPLNLERKTNNGQIISMNPNKMVLPEDIINPTFVLTEDEKNEILDKRTKELEAGVSANIDPRKIAVAELYSGLLDINGFIPEGWNIDKLNNIEADEIIEQRIEQLLDGDTPAINIPYNITNRAIAIKELKQGIIPITKYKRLDGRIVDPNMMLLPDQRKEGILTNDELINLYKKGLVTNDNLPIRTNQAINIDTNIVRNGKIYNIKEWIYPHNVNNMNEVLSWLDVDKIINDRSKQLSLGNKSYIPTYDLAMMELKYGLTPGTIKRDKEFLKFNEIQIK